MKDLFETGVVKWATLALLVFLGVQSLSGIMSLRYIGSGVQPTNTISVSGYGEAFGVADIATFSFSVSSKKATVAAAQAGATAKINAATKDPTEAGIDKKDIQTTDYSVNPQYDYVQGICSGGYCPGGKQVLSGYEVRQTTSVKVRIISFNENGGGYPGPMYSKAVGMGMGGDVAQSAPEISVGQNKVTSNVSVTYEIR